VTDPVTSETLQQKNNLNIPCTKLFKQLYILIRKQISPFELIAYETLNMKQKLPKFEKKSNRHLTDRAPVTRKLSNSKII